MVGACLRDYGTSTRLTPDLFFFFCAMEPNSNFTIRLEEQSKDLGENNYFYKPQVEVQGFQHTPHYHKQCHFPLLPPHNYNQMLSMIANANTLPGEKPSPFSKRIGYD